MGQYNGLIGLIRYFMAQDVFGQEQVSFSLTAMAKQKVRPQHDLGLQSLKIPSLSLSTNGLYRPKHLTSNVWLRRAQTSSLS